MRNFWTGILIVAVLALTYGYKHQNIINQQQAKQLAAYQQELERLNSLVQANWRDIEAISSHVMLWAEEMQYRPGVK
jgi:sensor domain CHASE-containing protein